MQVGTSIHLKGNKSFLKSEGNVATTSLWERGQTETEFCLYNRTSRGMKPWRQTAVPLASLESHVSQGATVTWASITASLFKAFWKLLLACMDIGLGATMWQTMRFAWEEERNLLVVWQEGMWVRLPQPSSYHCRFCSDAQVWCYRFSAQQLLMTP